jgi:hypothetical protein
MSTETSAHQLDAECLLAVIVVDDFDMVGGKCQRSDLRIEESDIWRIAAVVGSGNGAGELVCARY